MLEGNNNLFAIDIIHMFSFITITSISFLCQESRFIYFLFGFFTKSKKWETGVLYSRAFDFRKTVNEITPSLARGGVELYLALINLSTRRSLTLFSINEKISFFAFPCGVGVEPPTKVPDKEITAMTKVARLF